MICRNCGGQNPDGAKACGFCETELCGADKSNNGEPTDMEKRLTEILMGACGVKSTSENAEMAVATKADEDPKPTWWKEEDCGSCGGGLTGPDKDLKYVLGIVVLIVGVIGLALILNNLLGI